MADRKGTLLSDLRAARAHLGQVTPSDRVDNEEQRAIEEIDRAIAEIKNAAIDDGKNLNDHPPVDEHMDRRGRFHRALELLDPPPSTLVLGRLGRAAGAGPVPAAERLWLGLRPVARHLTLGRPSHRGPRTR